MTLKNGDLTLVFALSTFISRKGVASEVSKSQPCGSFGCSTVISCDGVAIYRHVRLALYNRKLHVQGGAHVLGTAYKGPMLSCVHFFTDMSSLIVILRQGWLRRNELVSEVLVSELLIYFLHSRLKRQRQPGRAHQNVTLCGDRACRTHKK